MTSGTRNTRNLHPTETMSEPSFLGNSKDSDKLNGYSLEAIHPHPVITSMACPV